MINAALIRPAAGPLAHWLQYEANERADLLAFEPAHAHKSGRQLTTVSLASILAQYFQALSLSKQEQFLLAVAHQHIELAIVKADMALATSGSIPFLRLDCYRNWFLAQGYGDLFAQLRQPPSALVPATAADTDLQRAA